MDQIRETQGIQTARRPQQNQKGGLHRVPQKLRTTGSAGINRGQPEAPADR